MCDLRHSAVAGQRPASSLAYAVACESVGCGPGQNLAPWLRCADQIFNLWVRRIPRLQALLLQWKQRNATENFDTYQNLQPHRAVLPAIAWHLVQSSVVTQTVLGGLTIHPVVANFLYR